MKKNRAGTREDNIVNSSSISWRSMGKIWVESKRSKNTIFEDQIQWWAKTSYTYQRDKKTQKNESEIEHAYIQSDSARQPYGPLMSTTNNKQHPKTSRKSRNNSMIAKKNWKHMPIMLEITPLQQCWLGFKLFSKAAHLQTRFSSLSYLQKKSLLVGYSKLLILWSALSLISFSSHTSLSPL